MTLAGLLLERRIVQGVEVATGRDRFWANFGQKQPMQIVVTDGALRQHPEPVHLGMMEYEIVNNPTYVLIVEYEVSMQRWMPVYVYFYKRHALHVKQFKHELRGFLGHMLEFKQDHKKLEELLDELLPHE